MIARKPGHQVLVLEREAIFHHAASRLLDLSRRLGADGVAALTGGSTPKAFYGWASANGVLAATRGALTWTVSDERHVPEGSDDSNFGTARRLLLDGLGVSGIDRWPWPVDLGAPEAAEAYAQSWKARKGDDGVVYDLCFLGLGDDSHTASIFPGSPLLDGDAGEEPFAAVEVPGKGWRLTVTPAGLARCPEILVTATGKSKSAAVAAVFAAEGDVRQHPARLLHALPGRVTWLLDPEAAAQLPLR